MFQSLQREPPSVREALRLLEENDELLSNLVFRT